MRAGVGMTPEQLRTGSRTAVSRPRPIPHEFAMSASLIDRLRAFARSSRGGAPIELALGSVVMLSSVVLCFDLYSRIEADTSITRMAATMADYVSRETAPDGAEMNALGQFLHDHELHVPADVVYVVTALHQPSGVPRPDVDVLWSDDTIRIGDPAVTAQLAAGCARHVDDGGAAVLPDDFTMSDDEIVVIAEVCARLTREGSMTGKFIAGDIYRLHALPARDPDQRPVRPAHVQTSSGHPTVASGVERTAESGEMLLPATRSLTGAASVRT